MLKKNGFTLAEVLITLCIIGLVAALTLPTLSSNLQKYSMETQISKFYSQLNEGIRRFMAVEQVSNINDADFDADKFVREYMNVKQTCADKNDDACFAKEYTSIKDKSIKASKENFFTDGEGSDKAYILADGMTFNMEGLASSGPINIYVDVNGKKGPNVIGYDLQSMSLFYDGTLDEGEINPEVRKSKTPEEIKAIVKSRFDRCLTDNYGGCFGHLLRNNFKFDY